MSSEKFKYNGYPVTGPSRSPVNIVKNDSGVSVSNSLESVHRLYVGTAGHVAVITKTSSAVFYNFQAGEILPVTDITHVMSTTTTASAFVAMQ